MYPKMPDYKYHISKVTGFLQNEVDKVLKMMEEKVKSLDGLPIVIELASILSDFVTYFEPNTPVTPFEISPLSESFEDKIVSERLNFIPEVTNVTAYNWELMYKPDIVLGREGCGVLAYLDQIWIYGGSRNGKCM